MIIYPTFPKYSNIFYINIYPRMGKGATYKIYIVRKV